MLKNLIATTMVGGLIFFIIALASDPGYGSAEPYGPAAPACTRVTVEGGLMGKGELVTLYRTQNSENAAMWLAGKTPSGDVALWLAHGDDYSSVNAAARAYGMLRENPLTDYSGNAAAVAAVACAG